MRSQYPPLNAPAAAAYLGVTKRALYSLVFKKQVSCYRPTGKMLYFSREDLDDYVFRNRTAATPELHTMAEELLIEGGKS